MMITSKTRTMVCIVEDVKVRIVPASVYCYTVGYNIIYHKRKPHHDLPEQPEIKFALRKPIISPPQQK